MAGLDNYEVQTQNMDGVDMENLRYLFGSIRDIEGEMGVHTRNELFGPVENEQDYEFVGVTINVTEHNLEGFYDELVSDLENDTSVSDLREERGNGLAEFKLNSSEDREEYTDFKIDFGTY